MKRSLQSLIYMVCFFTWAATAQAQTINLDKPVRAGELTVFPDISNENQYYYVPDKPKLARDANGKPKFSFLRYVNNEVSAAGQPANAEGTGGGILHAVVSLAISPEQIRTAQRELQRKKSSAVIMGPVVYRSGTFSIVSSFKDPNGGLSTAVCGLGMAPALERQEVAVSMLLTKQGAKILWESFNSVAPDISFSFEMEIGGYREPKKALLEANFDQIYNHHAFGVGFASAYLSAEIRGAFDDLTRNGAIKLTQVGEDTQMDALITTAYNKIAELMFSPLNGSGTPNLGDLAALSGSQGGNLMDRAGTLLQRSRAEALAANREADARAAAEGRTTGGTTTGGTATGGTTTGGTRTSTDSTRRDTTRRDSTSPTAAAIARGVTAPGTNPPGASGRTDSTRTNTPTNPNTANRETVPSFAIVAAYEMKRVRQTGTFRIDFNKSLPDKLEMRFDGNIGDLTSFKTDNTVFREVNLESPLFTQRELMAFVDGMNLSDFGTYVNFVNVRLKKTHQSGEITNQEVRIDRNNFNSAGNNFKMVYGWKGDNDRSNWMNYEYETEWSFFGGQNVIVPLQASKAGAINLAPPFQKRSVEFTADPAAVTANNIRLITVKLFYTLNGNEHTKVVTLNPSRNQLSERVEFLLPANSFDFQYQVNWKLANSTERNSERLPANGAIVFVDNLPNS
ncbi:MAG: hypothetical protein P0Y53_21350 [Candidatus Pseudobacter hemicellulosilyticus]|uniref:Uncharacterized protein n=1 Tax=Candidatus Pseudobacter hemicellulosilyticus TaxID=3121375 RepID=A0AAJ6BFE7_9BACT|nr:MAG: hypothetical protein P0Y53_21350 [Pseudobacter sp.]